MKEAIRTFFYAMKIAKITKSIDYSTIREEEEKGSKDFSEISLSFNAIYSFISFAHMNEQNESMNVI